MNSTSARPRSTPPSPCSTKAPPCPSSPATARKSPAAWTTRNCATLEERLGYLRELEERRAAILASIEEQGKLTPELKAEIEDAETKQRLEDLYLPYKQKRRTKAQIAREAGIEPLAAGPAGQSRR